MLLSKLHSIVQDVARTTPKPAVRFTLMPGRSDENLLSSGLGGRAYWERGTQYPTDSQGAPLALVMQVNFAHLPELPFFPRVGILQWFVSNSDEMYGLDMDAPQDQTNFRVVYWPEPSVMKQDAAVVDCTTTEFMLSPATAPFTLEPHLVTEYVGLVDAYAGHGAQLQEQMEAAALPENDFYELDERQELSGNGTKIGGYAYFVQNDPRPGLETDDGDNPWVLLAQVDSDYSVPNGPEWGDAGVGNLFIRRQDLTALDFSRVWFEWACS